MTRLVQTRVTDEQFDWLVERAVDSHDGELSAAVRSALDDARLLERILAAEDPIATLQGMFAAGEAEEARNAYRDHHGHYPEEA
jgi:hypothetical protein